MVEHIAPNPGITGPLLRKALTRSQLLAAWEKVRANNGCAGVDGVSVEAFASGVQARLDALRAAVLGGRYLALPLLRLWLPRSEGKAPRGLAVPCMADRVLQTSLAMVLQPLFEAEFEDCSFAYRQGRSVRQAVERVASLQRQGYRWVVDGDIEAFFDQIPHAPLLAELGAVVGDASVVGLVGHWLATPISDKGVIASPAPEPARGVAQGSPISPMLANLYLDHLDEALLHEDLALVRYADDFVILTRTRAQAETALELTEHTLAGLQLKLNDHKTRIVHLDAGLDFLGWAFVRSLAVPRSRGAPPEPATRPVGFAQGLPLHSPPRALDGSATGMAPEAEAVEIPAAPGPAAMAEAFDEARALALAADIAALGHGVGLGIDQAPADAVEPGLPPNDGGAEARGEALGDEPALPDADALQRTLYVVEPGCELGKESERLLVRKGEVVLLEVAVMHVDQVVLFGQHGVSAAAMHLCLKNRVPVVFLSRLGRFVGRLEAPDASHSALLIAQVNGVQDAGFRLALAQQFVAAKLDHSALLLARYSRHHAPPGEAGEKLHNTVLQMREDRRRVKAATSLESLRGLEGQAARAYFEGLRLLLGPEWGFTARLKLPPPDPVNAMLSLGYTLLYHSVAGLLQARGLNAYLGVFHSSGGEHFALASDVMEEFRSVVVDALVLDSCLNGLVSLADFKVHSDGCSLSPEATRRFIRAFEEKLGPNNGLFNALELTQGGDLRRRIDQQAMRLCQALHGRNAQRYAASAYR